MKPQSKIYDYIRGDSHHDGIIRVEYSPYANNQTRLIGLHGIDDQAVRRKFQEGISIDGAESLDLDDAVWAERTAGGYAVFAHISDVTEAVPTYSPLDLEALKRTTSVYRRDGVVNMFPPPLSQNLLSLNEDGEKLTLSMRIDLDHEGVIVGHEAFESTFRNRRRYDYESFVDDYLNPDSEFHPTLQLMYEIASKRKARRKSEGASMDYDESDRRLSIGGKTEKTPSSRKAIPTSIVEEFMILANVASAMIAAKNGYDSIFRLHRGMEERAYYHNAPGLHAGLAQEYYTHFTSPIRRYSDMVVHRVLKQLHLRGEAPPYARGEIADIANYVNFSRVVIDILGRNFDREIRGRQIVSKLKARTEGPLNVSHFTQSIREMVGAGKAIPDAVTQEIINDLENGSKSNWAWAIGVLLVSGNEKIKKYLKKALLDDRKFQAKAVLALLNVTKVTTADDECLFRIVEEEKGNEFSITTYFRGKKLFRNSINSGKIEPKDAVGRVRNRVLERIVRHFCSSAPEESAPNRTHGRLKREFFED